MQPEQSGNSTALKTISLRLVIQILVAVIRWSKLIVAFSIIQLLTGLLLARYYDRQTGRFFLWSVLYPLGYWVYLSFITVASTPAGFLLKSRGPTK